MEVYFATKKLAETLLDGRRRARKCGPVMAAKLETRLNQLASAESLETVRTLAGGCHELREDRQGQLASTLTKNWRLVFRPTEDPPPTRDDGGLDWLAVTAITILEVADYHGD